MDLHIISTLVKDKSEKQLLFVLREDNKEKTTYCGWS